MLPKRLAPHELVPVPKTTNGRTLSPLQTTRTKRKSAPEVGPSNSHPSSSAPWAHQSLSRAWSPRALRQTLPQEPHRAVRHPRLFHLRLRFQVHLEKRLRRHPCRLPPRRLRRLCPLAPLRHLRLCLLVVLHRRRRYQVLGRVRRSRLVRETGRRCWAISEVVLC